MEVLAIVPARGGSKGIPRKNIMELGGKPLLAWSIEAGLAAEQVSRLILSTEDEEIAKVGKAYGAEVPFLRPKHLARDDSPTYEAIAYTLLKLEEEEGYRPDYVLLLQPTSPLRSSEQVDEAIGLLREQGEAKALISVTTLDRPLAWNRRIHHGFLEKIVNYDPQKQYQRQQFEDLYRHNGAIYLIERDHLLSIKAFEDEKTLPYLMDEETSLDVDRPFDAEIADYFLRKRQKG